MNQPQELAASRPRERAYSLFAATLFSRKIVPGQFVSQRELVEIIGLPIAAIRELIPRLEAEGLIKSVPQRGLQVAHVDLSLIRNAFQFRLMLEREAVVHFVTKASDSEMALLRGEHEEILRQAADDVTPALVQQAQLTDWGFHDKLIDSLGNEIVSSAYRANSIKIRLIRQAEVRISPSRLLHVMTTHLAIIELMQQRDAQGSQRLLTDHINSAKTRSMET